MLEVLEVKKLVTVLATSTPVTIVKKKAVGKSENLRSNLARVLYIQYSITFQKKSESVLALLDLVSKVLTINPTFAKELALPIRPTDIGVQKIDSTTLDTLGIVVAAFFVTNKANQVRFFKETFLMANVSPEIVLGIFFLTLSSANVNFLG